MPKLNENDCSFYLKDVKATSPTSIIFQMYLPDGRLRRSIGTIHPDHWAPEHQRPFPSKDKVLKETARIIDSIIEIIPVIKGDCKRNNRVISKTDMNTALGVILQKKQDKEPEAVSAEPGNSMFNDFEKIIEGMKNGDVLTKQKKRYKPETIKNYESRCLPKLRAFFKEKYFPTTWSFVTIETYDEFITWCHGLNLANNSIGVYIKCWKKAGKIALKKKWHDNQIFNDDEEFMILKEDTDDIYLDEPKIAKIYKQSVPEDHYDIARDWFVLDCYLGLRVSDLQTISDRDFAGKYFQFVNQKTGATVAIKINRFVRAIFKKWKGLPPPMGDGKLNEYIKIVAKMAGLKKKFIYKVTKGGKLVVETYEEWQMVSSHTCRRSFITNLLKMGLPHAHVMRLAGIKRYETLMRYFKQSAEEVAQETGEHKFFE
jgi:integrase